MVVASLAERVQQGTWERTGSMLRRRDDPDKAARRLERFTSELRALLPRRGCSVPDDAVRNMARGYRIEVHHPAGDDLSAGVYSRLQPRYAMHVTRSDFTDTLLLYHERTPEALLHNAALSYPSLPALLTAALCLAAAVVVLHVYNHNPALAAQVPTYGLLAPASQAYANLLNAL